jgi:hypothetical protein
MMFNVYGKGFLPLSTTFYHFLPPYLTLDDIDALSGGGLSVVVTTLALTGISALLLSLYKGYLWVL